MPNVMLPGERLTVEAAPVPVKFSVTGLEKPVPEIESVAFSAAAVDGVNVTAIEQVAPGDRLPDPTGQVFVCAKSVALAPAKEILLMLSAAGPGAVSVMV